MGRPMTTAEIAGNTTLAGLFAVRGSLHSILY